MTDKRKKETPDILGDMLSGKPAPAAGDAPKPKPAPVSKDEPPIKTTVYLSPDQLYRVDRVLAELRHADRSRRISRTDIIAAAVELALAGVDDANPTTSDLARRVMTN